MLNDILPLADPKSPSGVRRNATIWSRSVIISCHSYKLSFLLWKIPLTYNYTQNYTVCRLLLSAIHPPSHELTLIQGSLSALCWKHDRQMGSDVSPPGTHPGHQLAGWELIHRPSHRGTHSPPWPFKDQDGSLQLLGYQPSHYFKLHWGSVCTKVPSEDQWWSGTKHSTQRHSALCFFH